MSTTEIQKPDRPKTLTELLRVPAVQQQIAQALPSHIKPDRFLRVAANCLRRVPELAGCDQTSFFNAMLTLSQYGLEPDGRNAHLIPFRNNKKGIIECQLIIDYKGLVELAMRSGLVSTIHADVVCEKDEFEYDRGEVTRHRINLREDRGSVYAVYALVRFKDGATKCEVLSKSDVEAVRRRSRASSSGPWVTDWNEMAKKTAFRRLSKWLSLSAEFRDAVESDDDTLDTPRREVTRIADLMADTAPGMLPAPETSELADDEQRDSTTSESAVESTAPPTLDELKAAIAAANTAEDVTDLVFQRSHLAAEDQAAIEAAGRARKAELRSGK